MDISELREKITNIFLENKKYEEIPKDNYTDFSYPGWLLKLMKFNTQRYKVSDFGHFMSMETKSFFGMQLLTISFMPGEGVSVPYFLVDIMVMGKKRIAFLEYYDCTSKHPEMKNLEEVSQIYKNVPNYKEKYNWYISERTKYSLIKNELNDETLKNMVIDSVKAYNKELLVADIDEKNLKRLKIFRERMINEGNPSSSILEKVFGKEGAKEFFIKCVMPIDSDI